MDTMVDTKTAADMITWAYEAYIAERPAGTNSPWMSVTILARRVDLSIDEITEGVRHLMRTVPGFVAAPESNQKSLTQADRACALWIGNQDKHLIAF